VTSRKADPVVVGRRDVFKDGDRYMLSTCHEYTYPDVRILENYPAGYIPGG